MKKVFFTALLLMAVGLSLIAQKQPGDYRIKFRSQNYGGLLEGNAGSSFQVQTINGVQYRGWFGGIGTGIDYYKYRTIPLFLSVNKNIRSTGNSFYFLSDAGINFVWKKDDQRSRTNDFIRDEFAPALYLNGGAGYKAVIAKGENAVLISVAYSYKRVKETKEIPVFCINPPCDPSVEEYNYYLQRISIRLGWEF